MGGGADARRRLGGVGSCVLFPGPLAWLLFSKTNGRKSALLEIKLGNCILHPFEKTRLFSFSLFFRSISLTPLFRRSRANSLKDFPFPSPSFVLFAEPPPPLLRRAATLLRYASLSTVTPLPPPTLLRVYLFTILTASSSRFICITSSHPQPLLLLINPS